MKFFISVSILFAMVNAAFSMAGKIEKVPLKPAIKQAAKNGEFLRYGLVQGGERFGEMDMVTIITNLKERGDCALVYYDTIKYTDTRKMPSQYTDFASLLTISLSRGSLLESVYYDPEVTNKKGGTEFYQHLVVDYGRNVMTSDSRVWDGYDIKSRNARMMIKDPGYPIWDWIGCFFLFGRYLDISKPGIIYLGIPEVFKELFPGFIRPVKKEKIKVRAGEFDVIHCSFAAADPFIGQLFETYTREAAVFIEDSDRRITVRMHTALGMDFDLEEISNVIK